MKIKNICLLVALTFSFSGGVFASQPISKGDSDVLIKSQPYEKGRRAGVVRTPSRTVVRTPTRTVVRTPARAVVRTPAVVAAPVVAAPVVRTPAVVAAPVVAAPVVAAPVVVAPRRGVVVRPRRY